MGQCILDIKELSSNDTGNVDLKEINLEVTSSEVHALVGEYGAGKELVVNVLTGAEKKISGRVFFDGIDVTNKIKIGGSTDIMFLLEEPMVAEGLTVAENMYMLRSHSNVIKLINHSKINHTVKELIARFDLGISEKTHVYKLSTEEKKLIELLRLCIYEPRLVVLYEPTANLSSKSQDLLLRILTELKEKGTGILYVTNKWDEAMKYSDRISVLSEGVLCGTLSSEEAKDKPEKLLRLILGWKKSDSIKRETEEIETEDIIDAVLRAAEYLTSNYEINDVLKMLENYTCKIMESDSCYVYLVDEKTRTIMDTIKHKETELVEAALNDEVVMRIMDNKKLFVSNFDDVLFEKLFKSIRNTETIVCNPVSVRSHHTALFQVGYRKYYEPTEKQKKIFHTLSRQVALAIDNTRLMGSSVLLQESHHRIKNNLQTIVSLINIQKRSLNKKTGSEVEDLLDNVVSRVKSIAAVHDLLSHDELGRSIINLKSLVDTIVRFNIVDGTLQVRKDLDDIFIPYDKASGISLTISELINNCVKHAFKDLENGLISISCKSFDDNVEIIVEDNGAGFPNRSFSAKDEKLGLSLARSIVENQFDGTLEIASEKGAKVKILIPKESLLLTRGS
ncbi:ATP-binding cassette domain-containing protein [Mesotoga sp. H07.pep.5.3]|uniref:ATP-binding cassette domain-containing protein n=1 Tax=Mesotoga sp. H07.pep.5.3 TaxID=1421003 RepID=UPI000C188F57|nr:ATP-binding cassette domain-containing protein [Mesotoga sp. H07.pep.5.3]PIJ61396.1 sugar ABC transporter ATPase [Mesotoga sp. H07.pep.5.3]